jgi:hypothetical protein
MRYEASLTELPQADAIMLLLLLLLLLQLAMRLIQLTIAALAHRCHHLVAARLDIHLVIRRLRAEHSTCQDNSTLSAATLLRWPCHTHCMHVLRAFMLQHDNTCSCKQDVHPRWAPTH